MNFEIELLTTAIIVSSVLHIKAEYNGAQHSGNPYYERFGLGASSAVGTSANIICCVRRDFILNFRRTAGLESISDEIQISPIFNHGYLLCSPVGTSNVFRPTECLLFELIIYNHAKSVKKLSCSPKKFA